MIQATAPGLTRRNGGQPPLRAGGASALLSTDDHDLSVCRFGRITPAIYCLCWMIDEDNSGETFLCSMGPLSRLSSLQLLVPLSPVRNSLDTRRSPQTRAENGSTCEQEPLSASSSCRELLPRRSSYIIWVQDQTRHPIPCFGQPRVSLAFAHRNVVFHQQKASLLTAANARTLLLRAFSQGQDP